MYDELIKNLRHDSVSALQNCDFDFVHGWMLEAADAIEELQQIANILLVKYQEEATCLIWECNGCIDESLDHLQKEIRTLQAQIDGKSELLKEE